MQKESPHQSYLGPVPNFTCIQLRDKRERVKIGFKGFKAENVLTKSNKGWDMENQEKRKSKMRTVKEEITTKIANK